MQKVAVHKANVIIDTNDYNIQKPLEMKIILLQKPEDEILNCIEKSSPVNFALTESVLWRINEWKDPVSTVDISSIIQYAVDRDWYYGKRISILFLLLDDYIDTNYDFKLTSSSSFLQIYFKDYNPSK